MLDPDSAVRVKKGPFFSLLPFKWKVNIQVRFVGLLSVVDVQEDEILDLSGTHLDGIGVGYEIPSNIKVYFSIWFLFTTQVLDLTHVTCRKLENLDNLPHLLKICLRQNFITKIENLDKVTSLIELDLYDNQITQIENLNLPLLEYVPQSATLSVLTVQGNWISPSIRFTPSRGYLNYLP